MESPALFIENILQKVAYFLFFSVRMENLREGEVSAKAPFLRRKERGQIGLKYAGLTFCCALANF